jgi:hypothetical protein
MNQRTQTFLGIAAIIGIMVLSYTIFPGGRRAFRERDPIVTEIKDEIIKEPNIGLSTRTEIIEEQREELSYEIDAEYPQIIGLADSTAQEGINEKIHSFMLEKIDVFQETVQEMEQSEAEAERIWEIKSSFDADFFVALLNKEIASIKFNISEYYTGAAHPHNYTVAFNYDIEKREEIALESVFRPEIDYLSILSEKTKQALIEQFKGEIEGTEEWIDRGTAPEKENFQNFCFSRTDLIIFFNPYQIGPHALGGQFVEISYKQIEDYIDPDAPIAHLLIPDDY